MSNLIAKLRDACPPVHAEFETYSDLSVGGDAWVYEKRNSECPGLLTVGFAFQPKSCHE